MWYRLHNTDFVGLYTATVIAEFAPPPLGGPPRTPWHASAPLTQRWSIISVGCVFAVMLSYNSTYTVSITNPDPDPDPDPHLGPGLHWLCCSTDSAFSSSQLVYVVLRASPSSEGRARYDMVRHVLGPMPRLGCPQHGFQRPSYRCDGPSEGHASDNREWPW